MPNEDNPDAEPVERADAAANRQRILAAATRLFYERGVAAVTTDEVARAAGVGKGTLFRRFATRAELCLAVADAELASWERATRTQLTTLAAAGQPALEQLSWLLGALLEFNDARLDLLFEAARAQGPVGRPPLDRQYRMVLVLVDQAIAQGALRPGFSPALLADLLMAPTRPPILRLYRSLRGYSLAQVADELALLVRAIAR